jgi:putative redox protein
MNVSLKFQGGVSFEATTESGHSLVMDGAPSGGGNNLGARPMELLLAGLGGCTGYDVVSILNKSRQEISKVDITIEADRADLDPKVFTDIIITFKVSGKNLSRKIVERAIRLSADKYCSASIMLSKTAKISHELILLED